MSNFLRSKANGIINAGGWTATKLADELEITEAMLSRIRSGATVKIDWPTGERILAAWHAVTGVPTSKQLVETEKLKHLKTKRELRKLKKEIGNYKYARSNQ